MSEPSTGDKETPDEPAAGPPKPPEAATGRTHGLRNALIGVIGAPIFLVGLAVGGFALYAQIDPRDPNPKAQDFQPDRASSCGAYYRIRIDYLPRARKSVDRRRLHDLGASLFDEGLTTTVVAQISGGQGPDKRLLAWPGDRQVDFKGTFTAFTKQSGTTIALTVTRTAEPRLRWNIELPRWASDTLGALVPKAGADQPALIRIAPPAAGATPAVTTVILRDYKGIAIGDVYVTAQWRSSALFDSDLIRVGPAPNPAIADYVNRHGDAAARKFAVLRMLQSTASEFAEFEAMKAWIAQRFAAAPRNKVDRCAETFDTAIDRFGLVVVDAALLTYLVHRDGPHFTSAPSLTGICGRPPLGAALIAIGAPPLGKPTPAPAMKKKRVAEAKPDLTPIQILHRLAREWKSGLAGNRRADSMRYLRTDATLVKPNRFNLFPATPFADRAAILDDHAANRVRHFACFTQLAKNAVAAIMERQQGATTAVFRYRFFFDKDKRIYRIDRRKALQADINDVKFTLRGTACADEFLRLEEARIRQVIGGGDLAIVTPTRTAPPPTIIESTLSWQSPAPGGRARNRVTVDLNVLKSIPKNTSRRDGG